MQITPVVSAITRATYFICLSAHFQELIVHQTLETLGPLSLRLEILERAETPIETCELQGSQENKTVYVYVYDIYIYTYTHTHGVAEALAATEFTSRLTALRSFR